MNLRKSGRNKLLGLISLFVFCSAFASGTAPKSDGDSEGHGAVTSESEISEYILHHIKDAHDFHLFSYNDSEGHRKHIGFPLPVIVYTSKGIKTFMSSEFHHDDSGHHVVEKDGVALVKYHEKIYELAQGAHGVEFDEAHHPTNAHAVLDLSITKSVFGMLFVFTLLIFWFRRLALQYRKNSIPKGFF